jgi:PAS domain-containing protein
MTGPHIDYMAVFENIPIPVLLMTPDFVMVSMNSAYRRVSGRKREELVGRNVFDAFPDNPADPHATGVHNLRASLRGVLATGEADVMAMQKYDIEAAASPGLFEKRYWCPVNAPVFGPDGNIVLLAHCVEEVTDRVRKFVAAQIADL